MAQVETEHGLHQDVVYEIAVSGSLPVFDPLVTIKQKLLNPRQIKVFNRVIVATQCVFFPMYMIGFALRIPTIFAPAKTGRLLGPIAVVFQFPIVFQVVFAFRFEFVKVIVGTFEFWFLLLNATIWLFSFGFYLQDARAAITPSCWTDFVDMLLIETYFQNSQNVTIVATISAVFLLSLSVGVSLDAIHEVNNIELARLKSHAFSLKDVLANTMATMAMLLIRLSFRKRVSTVFYSELTMIPQLNAFIATMRANRVFAALHSGAGITGFLLLPAIFYSVLTGDDALAKYFSTASLTMTLAFWTPFVCCSQRQLAARLWSSFDFLFAYMQMALTHLALCDMLSWERRSCYGVFTSFIWMQGVLTLDKVPPIMRVRLGWRSWLIVPILLLYMTMQILLSAAVLQWKHEKFQNRLLLDSVIGGHQLKFYVIPFFLSRQFTSFVWSVRLLHRFCTRKSDDELLIMLGNVEYNYDHWRKARQQLLNARGPQLEVTRSLRQKLEVRFASARKSAAAIVPIGARRSTEPGIR